MSTYQLSDRMRKIKERVEKERNGQQTEESGSTYQLSDRMQQIRQKVESSRNTYGVDDAFISSFQEDAGKFIKTSNSQLSDMSYKTAMDSAARTGRSRTLEDLDRRAALIRAYANSNRSALGEEAFGGMISYLDQFRDAYGTISKGYRDFENYYSKWATEEDYTREIGSRGTVKSITQTAAGQKFFRQKLEELAGEDDVALDAMVAELQAEYDRVADSYSGSYSPAEYAEHSAAVAAVNEKYGSLAGLKEKIANTQKRARNVRNAKQQLPQVQFAEKYAGQSYSQLMATMDTLDPGSEEYHWIKEYAPTVMSAADYPDAIERINAEIEQKKQKQAQMASAYSDMSHEEFDRQYSKDLAAIKGDIEKLEQKRWKLQHGQQYVAIPESEDFRKKSGYVSTLRDTWLGQTYADPLYEYINNYDGARKKLLDSSEGDSLGDYFVYDYMTDDEVKVFNYVYATSGADAARDYLDYLEYDLNARLQDQTRQKAAKYAEDAPVWSSVVSVPANLASGMGYMDVALQKLKNWASGSDKPIDYNTPAMGYNTTATTIRGTVAQKITDSTGTIQLDEQEHPVLSEIFNGKGWADVYQLGMSMADSAAVAALSPFIGSAGTVLLGGSAATQGMLDAVENGASDSQALTMGLLNGAAEIVFEKYSLESLLNGPTDSLIKTMLRQGVAEGSEEFFTSAANNLSDALVMAEKSGYMRNVQQYRDQGYTESEAVMKALTDMGIDMGWDFAGGMFTGGIMGGGSYASNKVQQMALDMLIKRAANHAQTQAAEGKNASNAQNVMEEVTGVKEQLRSNQDKLNAMDTVADIQTPGDFPQMSISEKMNWVIEKLRSTNYSVDRKGFGVIKFTAKQLKSAFNYFTKGGVEEAAFEAMPYVLKNGTEISSRNSHKGRGYGTVTIAAPVMINGQRGNMAVVVKQTTDNYYKVHRILTPDGSVFDMETMNEAEPTPAGESPETGSLATPISSASMDSIIENVPTVNENDSTGDVDSSQQVIRTTDDAAVQITGVAQAGGGKLTMTLTDGSTADVAELSFPDSGVQALYQTVASLAANTEEARLLLDNFSDSSLPANIYARAIEEMYQYGKLQYTQDAIGKTRGLVSELSPAQQHAAYAIGQNAAERAAQQRDKEAAECSEARQRKGRVNYGYEGQKVNRSKLNPSQRIGVDFAQMLAQRKGMTFYFYRSYENEQGERVYKNREGKIVKADKNGHYDPSDGTIHIDLNCGNMGDSVLFTIAHELTHFIQDWSAQRYRTLCSILMEGYDEMGQSVDELVRNKQTEYSAAGEELSYEQAYAEVIASSMEGVLSDGRVLDLLDDIETADKTLYERLCDFLSEVADLLRDLVTAYADKKPESPEGRIVQRMDNIREQLQQAFAEGLHEGGENYRQGGKENTAPEGGMKKSIVALDNGNVYVQASRNVITGTTKAEQRANITDFFNALLQGNSSIDIPTIEGDVLTISKAATAFKARDDYKTVSGNPVQMTDTEFAVKLRVEAHIDEIAETSTPKGKTKTPDTKNHSFGKDGFTYRRAYFEDFDGQYYEVTLSIGHNGTVATVYNVGKINKSALPSAKILAVVGSKPLSKALSSGSIRNSKGNVNKNSIRYQRNAAAAEHLERENAAMGEDVEALNRLLDAQRRQDGGARLRGGALKEAAAFLMKTAGAKGDKQAFMEILDRFYHYIGQTTALTWDDIRRQAQPVVDWLMDHTVRSKQVSEYARDILDHLRTSRIYLDDTQRGEVAHLYGSFGAYRNLMMGSIVIANEGSVSLDGKWQELAQLYPDVFDADTNSSDMPEALLDAVTRLRNTDTSELEYEYNRDFIAQELLNRVYDSYWNASTLYILADQYEKQIRSLKGQHKQRMNQVYQRHRNAEAAQKAAHRQRQEAIAAHYEERYQRREAEYRESRQKATERHARSEMRRKISNVISALAKLNERAPRDKRTKEELREFADSALKVARLVFMERYDERDMVRNGVGIHLTPEAQRLMAECKELLERLDEMAEQGPENMWDPDEAMEHAKRVEPVKAELAKRMHRLREMEVFKAEFERINGITVKEVFNELLEGYQKLKKTESIYLKGAFQQVIYDRIRNVGEEIGAKSVRDMSLKELETVYNLYTAIVHVIRSANTTLAQEHAERYDQLGTQVVDELNEQKRHSYTNGLLETLKNLKWENLTPVYVFRIINSKVLGRLYNAMVEGQSITAKDIKDAKDFWQQQANKYGAWDWDMDKRITVADSTGKEFSVSLNQLMSLYAHSKRKQSLQHLEAGGLMLDKGEIYVEKKVDKLLKRRQTGCDTYKLDKTALEAICNSLSKEQKAFVDATQKYMSEVMGEKGNEVSMKLWGIKLFKEQNYFPIHTASETRYESTELIDQKKLKNSGFTKELQPDATNALVLSGYSYVWTEHINQMSLYHGMTLPMEDMDRVLNFGRTWETDENGEVKKDKDGKELVTVERDSVCVAMQNVFGEHPDKCIRDLMKELNGGVLNGNMEALSAKWMSRFKKSAVSLSLSVWIQQWTSVFRAMAYIDPKHFIRVPNNLKQRNVQAEQMKKYCGIALVKEIGGFSTGMGKSVHDYITMQDLSYADIEGKVKAWLKNPVKRFDDLASWAPARADENTWISIWMAAKKEIREKHKELHWDSEEIYKLAADRFTEVINLTQVYDSVLSKSAMMRKHKMFTSFAAEPTLALNMSMDAIRQTGRDKKIQVRVSLALVGSIFMNSLCSSLVYAMRDDDEDETFLDKWSSAMLSSFIDGLNPITYVPVLRDIWSSLQGYDVTRMDMELWTSFNTAVMKLIRKLSSDNATETEKTAAWWGLLDAVFNMVGIPLRNVRREGKAFYNIFNTLGKDFGGRAATGRSLGDAVQEAAMSSIPLVNQIWSETRAEKLLDALEAGDEKYSQRLLDLYDSEEDSNTALKKVIRERFEDGDITEEKALQLLQDYAGRDKESAQEDIIYWKHKLEHSDSTLARASAINWEKEAKAAGIGLEEYTQWREEFNKLASDKDKNGKVITAKKEKVLDLIDSLPLTRKQKDVLYLDAKYDEDNLKDTPWH